MAPKPDAGLFKWADFYRSAGCSVIPLRGGKLPAVPWLEFQQRIAARTELMKWFVDSGWGMAIVCGSVSGNLVRLDFDDPDDYEALKGDLPVSAPVFRSQRKGGGFGLLMRSHESIPLLPQKTFKNYPKLEVRGEGGITVVPPTPGYEWLNFDSIPTVHVKQFLNDLLDFDLDNRDNLARSVESSAGNELEKLLKETDIGGRSNNLVRIASMLRARGIDLDTAMDVMRHNFDEHWPKDGMNWDEAEGVFERAWKRYEHEGVRYGGKGRMAQHDDDSDEELEATWIEDIQMPTEDDALIEKLVLAGESGNTVIASPTKMGKTSLVLDACITATRGEPAWGLLSVSKPLRVAYIDQERKHRQLRESQDMMADVIGRPAPKSLLVMTQKTGQFEIGHNIMSQLTERLMRFKPDLTVIDGYGWLVGHRESDPDYVKPAMAWLKEIRQSIGCATIIIHHFKKAQFASMGDHGQTIDLLDQIAGLKRLVDQAQTALVYLPIAGYDTFNLLDGKTNKPSWDPIKTVIDYDHTTLTHRAIAADEGCELFDPDTFRNLWGTASAESRQLKGMINTIRNRLEMTQGGLASAVGVDQAQVSRWYSGRQNPGKAAMDRLGELYKKAKQRPLRARRMPRPAQPPDSIREMAG